MPKRSSFYHSKSGQICPDFECFLSPSLDRFIKKRVIKNILFMPKRSRLVVRNSDRISDAFGRLCPVRIFVRNSNFVRYSLFGFRIPTVFNILGIQVTRICFDIQMHPVFRLQPECFITYLTDIQSVFCVPLLSSCKYRPRQNIAQML